ncbi:hypothetical protein PAXRUDRAFT_174955 [Paxillus rubicundulus Ve08.2h10]|uniref:Uncharacterized protein n=1 Tax=Paxillus rubicundulus Ve08.2h10 TaxID=930991 RepID=A0A0D0BTB4_9AGAM|nr:hypothetical protein PAXRUDRAFT_174955 [Paxillus rubicundulus Ve08.2h10]
MQVNGILLTWNLTCTSEVINRTNWNSLTRYVVSQKLLFISFSTLSPTNSPQYCPDSLQLPFSPPSPLWLPSANINIVYKCRPCPDIDLDELECSVIFQPMSDTLSFVQALRNASTTDPVTTLSDEALDTSGNIHFHCD